MKISILKQGIQKYGTPLYVFHTEEMEDTVSLFRRMTGNAAALCYAMKANPFLTEQMAALTDRIEVCSMGEYHICRELGISPEKLLISGVLKEKEDLDSILNDNCGRCLYSVESLQQFYHLANWSNEKKERLHIFLRLTSGNQFGMDRETIRNLFGLRSQYPFLDIQGIHYFSGTQKVSVETVESELLFLDCFLKELQEHTGLWIRELEYGPGLTVPYFKNRPDTFLPDIRALERAVSDMQWSGQITLEMGRALVAFCGYYLTGIRDLKQNNGTLYCITDGGMHQLHYDGQIRGMHRPMFRITPKRTVGTAHSYTICGSLCTANDVLMQNIPLCDPAVGDVLIFEHTGAYSVTEGMALFLSHELPPVALYSRKNGWTLLRERLPAYPWNSACVPKMRKEITNGYIDTNTDGNR